MVACVIGAEGAEILPVLSEEDWRAGVGFADWVGLDVGAFSLVCVGLGALWVVWVG